GGESVDADTWLYKSGRTLTGEVLDINCGCCDPNRTFVLNPKAWQNPPEGHFGTSNAHFTDYRMQRRPAESMSIARIFRFKERATLMLRAEFTNIFNRTGINVPSFTAPLSTPTTDRLT